MTKFYELIKKVEEMTLIELVEEVSGLDMELAEGYTFTDESLNVAREMVINEIEKREAFLKENCYYWLTYKIIN